ncbi:MAG: hypothetical protein ACFNYP_10995 [Corynebacterium matruchotii]
MSFRNRILFRWLPWACLIVVIPSALWRIAMLCGVSTGFAETNLYRGSLGGTVYVLTLEVVQLAAASACVYLAYVNTIRYGRLPLIIGGIGNLLLYYIMGYFVIILIRYSQGADVWTPMRGMDATQRLWLYIAYGPFLTWPLLLTGALFGYQERRKAQKHEIMTM